MTLDVMQSMMVIIVGILAIVILLRVLFIVHRQAQKYREMETRLRAIEKVEAADTAEMNNLREV